MMTDMTRNAENSLYLSSDLTGPLIVEGRVVARILFDLTLYLNGLSEDELAWFIQSYRHVCPSGNQTKYKIAEFGFWPSLSTPLLTASGRAALKAGIPDAFLEPVRRRIRDGRAFELQIWDGRSIDDSGGTWSFNCQRILRRSTGSHTFVRFLFPLDTSTDLIATLAKSFIDSVNFSSGHGGLVFTFDPWFIASAFDAIYTKAKRYWCIDIEDLNHTLPIVANHIKGVSWLNLISHKLQQSSQITTSLAEISRTPSISMANGRYGTMLTIGSVPVTGDQHRGRDSIMPYIAVARALKPLYIDSHPDFPGTRFTENNNTTAWIRRFLEPDMWRH